MAFLPNFLDMTAETDFKDTIGTRYDPHFACFNRSIGLIGVYFDNNAGRIAFSGTSATCFCSSSRVQNSWLVIPVDLMQGKA